MRRVIVFCVLACVCSAAPARARMGAAVATDRELAARGAALYGLLLDISRSDADVPAVAFSRVACRMWAYQSLENLIAGSDASEHAPPPHAEGWKDLLWLLFQTQRFDDALKILDRAGSAFGGPDRLFLEMIIRQNLGLGADRPASRLLESSQNPIIAASLVRNWFRASPPPFRKDNYALPYKPDAGTQMDIIKNLLKVKKELDGREDREEEPDTWTLMTREAAPGQEILIKGRGPGEPIWRGASFSQNRKTFPAQASRIAVYREPRTGVNRGSAVLGVPRDMAPGIAILTVPGAGSFEVRLNSFPSPAKIISAYPRKIVPGGWIRLDCVGLRTSRRLYLQTAERDNAVEWDLSAQFSQSGRDWIIDRNVQVWRGWVQEIPVFRVPWALVRGTASIRLKLADAVSEPYYFEMSDWPDFTNFRRSGRDGDLVAMPNASMKLTFQHPSDGVAGLVEHPSGRRSIWRPESASPPGQANAESRWRVPKEWDVGMHEVVWAAREGGLWSIARLAGETLTVSPFAAAPKNLRATYIRAQQEGTVTTLGAKGYESVPYRNGDIMINGEGIETGETYDVTVQFVAGNTFAVRKVSSHDFIMMVSVSPTGPAPDKITVQRVVAGIAGMPATLAVGNTGGVMGDLFTAQTAEGKVAVDWLTDVRSKLRSAQFQDQPSAEKLLWTLRIDTFPASPWGGQWTYVRTPGHESLTFLAHDWQGNLRAQFYSGGIGAGLVEYDLLTREVRGETCGISADNFYWTFPWSTNGLGNLVTDAMRSAAPCDISVHNTLGLRGNLPAGVVTRRIIEHMLPFDNGIVVLHLKGSDLLDLYKEAYESGKFLYVSGMTVEVDSVPGRLDARFDMGFGNRFAPDATYRVAMPSYLAEKRAGYPKTEKASQRDDIAVSVRQALRNYIASNRPPLKADRTARVRERFR